jgi:Predicted dehydrogenase
MNFDIVIIGAGISGAGAGYALAGQRKVLLLEGEAQPGYHSTGRSAAVYEPNMGKPPCGPSTSPAGLSSSHRPRASPSARS